MSYQVSGLNRNKELLQNFAEWINKEGYEPLHLRGGENMWRRGEHCNWNSDFEPKDNEDLAIEYLKQLNK